MWRYIMIGGVLVAVATQVPPLLEARLDEPRPAASPGQPHAAPAAAAPERRPEAFNPLDGRVARIESDARGHFLVRAKLNGAPVEVMVDTGATLVAINETTARRIGIRVAPADFRHAARTANGMTEMASAVIDEIEIGRIVVRDVPAAVLRDKALGGTLLGMSFLNKLRKFGVEAGTLVLAQ